MSTTTLRLAALLVLGSLSAKHALLAQNALAWEFSPPDEPRNEELHVVEEGPGGELFVAGVVDVRGTIYSGLYVAALGPDRKETWNYLQRPDGRSLLPFGIRVMDANTILVGYTEATTPVAGRLRLQTVNIKTGAPGLPQAVALPTSYDYRPTTMRLVPGTDEVIVVGTAYRRNKSQSFLARVTFSGTVQWLVEDIALDAETFESTIQDLAILGDTVYVAGERARLGKFGLRDGGSGGVYSPDGVDLAMQPANRFVKPEDSRLFWLAADRDSFKVTEFTAAGASRFASAEVLYTDTLGAERNYVNKIYKISLRDEELQVFGEGIGKLLRLTISRGTKPVIVASGRTDYVSTERAIVTDYQRSTLTKLGHLVLVGSMTDQKSTINKQDLNGVLATYYSLPNSLAGEVEYEFGEVAPPSDEVVEGIYPGLNGQVQIVSRRNFVVGRRLFNRDGKFAQYVQYPSLPASAFLRSSFVRPDGSIIAVRTSGTYGNPYTAAILLYDASGRLAASAPVSEGRTIYSATANDLVARRAGGYYVSAYHWVGQRALTSLDAFDADLRALGSVALNDIPGVEYVFVVRAIPDNDDLYVVALTGERYQAPLALYRITSSGEVVWRRDLRPAGVEYPTSIDLGDVFVTSDGHVVVYGQVSFFEDLGAFAVEMDPGGEVVSDVKFKVPYATPSIGLASELGGKQILLSAGTFARDTSSAYQVGATPVYKAVLATGAVQPINLSYDPNADITHYREVDGRTYLAGAVRQGTVRRMIVYAYDGIASPASELSRRSVTTAQMYPNPVRSGQSVQIEGAATTFVFFDASGRRVASVAGSSSSGRGSAATYALPALASGIYKVVGMDAGRIESACTLVVE